MPYSHLPNEFPELRGCGLWLRELEEIDLPAWFARLRDVEAASLAGDAVATSMQTVVDGLAHHRRAFRDKEAIRWSIVPDTVGASVGSIGLGGFDAERRCASIGAAVGRHQWGQGIATDAARLVIEYAFTALDLQRIDAVTLPENTRVARVLEKLGFSRLPDTAAMLGARADALSWALERSEKT